MSIEIIRDQSAAMRHIVHVRKHEVPTDIAVKDGGGDTGPDPHDLYDSALGACKALTVIWYAKKKNIPVEDIRVTVERDGSEEREGKYTLNASVAFSGNLTDEQRNELLAVAEKCPVHKLMTQVTTIVNTTLVDYVATGKPASDVEQPYA
jgi:putative redox protein